MTNLTPDQIESLKRFEEEHLARCQRIMKMYEKPPYVREKPTYNPLTKKEIGWFKKMGCIVTVNCNGHSYVDKTKSPTEANNTTQNKLF